MAVTLEIIDGGVHSLVQVTDDNPGVINIENVVQQVAIQNPASAVVVEVLTGLPGVQNLYVGEIPPSNPQEGWIWIVTT